METWAGAGVEMTVHVFPPWLGGDQSDVQAELVPSERSAVHMYVSRVESLTHEEVFQSFFFLMRKEARDANQITPFNAMSELDISFGFSPDLS